MVSTDKAADPASFMGATKLLLEAAAVRRADEGGPRTSAARFANVAYSSGSLLESYVQRFDAGQALAAPRDTRRYFISARDAARICLLAQLTCPPARIAIPRFDPASGAVELAETAARLPGQPWPPRGIRRHGRGGSRARRRPGPDYPVLLTPRDTAGEKEIEVFRGEGEGAAAARPHGAGGRDPRADRRATHWRRRWPIWPRSYPAIGAATPPTSRRSSAACCPDSGTSPPKPGWMTGSSPPRRIALAIHRLAPAGGLEQHALRLGAILVGSRRAR